MASSRSQVYTDRQRDALSREVIHQHRKQEAIGRCDFRDSMRLNSSPASFCASATCLVVIFGLSMILQLSLASVLALGGGEIRPDVGPNIVLRHSFALVVH